MCECKNTPKNKSKRSKSIRKSRSHVGTSSEAMEPHISELKLIVMDSRLALETWMRQSNYPPKINNYGENFKD